MVDAAVVDANLAIPMGLGQGIHALGECTLIAPVSAWLECANVLRRLERTGHIGAPVADRALSTIGRSIRMHEIDARLVELAVGLSRRLNHVVYDCIYLALAIVLNLPFLTLDAKLRERAIAAGLGDFVPEPPHIPNA